MFFKHSPLVRLGRIAVTWWSVVESCNPEAAGLSPGCFRKGIPSKTESFMKFCSLLVCFYHHNTSHNVIQNKERSTTQSITSFSVCLCRLTSKDCKMETMVAGELSFKRANIIRFSGIQFSFISSNYGTSSCYEKAVYM